MLTITRTTAQNIDFIALIKQLDAGLAITDGDDHAFYDQFNQLDTIKHVVVAYENGTPLGCGAIKAYDGITMEIKRMFTIDAARGKGIATKILTELEKWTGELGINRCILETGIRQYAALALYKKNDFTIIPNYGQYEGVEDSVCFEKVLG